MDLILKKVIKLIKERGIPKYVKTFNKKSIDLNKINLNNEDEFIELINLNILSKYHKHSFLMKNVHNN